MEASACWLTNTGEATTDFKGVGLMLNIRLNERGGRKPCALLTLRAEFLVHTVRQSDFLAEVRLVFLLKIRKADLYSIKNSLLINP